MTKAMKNRAYHELKSNAGILERREITCWADKEIQPNHLPDDLYNVLDSQVRQPGGEKKEKPRTLRIKLQKFNSTKFESCV